MTRTKLFPKFSMKSIAIKSFIGALLVIIGFQTSAQQFYPVRVQPTVVFPSVFLNDYTIPENFRVLVSLNDANESDYSIFLKVRFRSDDYELNSIVGIRLTLNGGQTYMLDQQELSDLFSLGDLTITNNSSSGGSQTTLPEGIFTVSFSAFDATTPTIPVSNSLTDFTIAPVLQNDPPLLNQPSNGEEIDVQFAGQNIMFSWTPRNVAVSPTRPIKYTLKLVQVVPVDRNPYQAIQTGTFVVNNQPFDGIEYPMFIFDQSNFELLPGAVYAWQVDAYEEATVDGVLGKSTLRFKNGGASEVYTFKVKENCPEVIIQNPPVLEADPVTGKDLIALNWTPDPLHKQFEVKYREAGTILPWNVIQQAEPTFKLSEAELLRGLSYEYTVTPKCNSWQSAQYGGEFSLEKKECEAPTPILIEVNDGTILSLKWEATEFATAYKVSYEHDIDPLKTGFKDVIDGATVVSLDPITEGNYEIKVDAICGSLTDEGESMTLAFNETNVVGGCPLPSPIEFLGLRSDEMNATELDADVSWAFSDIHESYKLTWWHRDSVNKQQVVTLSDPEAMIANILDDQLYKYTLEFTCQGGKKVTTPEGGFRIDGSASGGSTNPGTADCFPPSILSAEPRDIDEGRFEWNKVTGASEYQLHYWEEPGGQVQIFTSTAGNATIKDLIENGTYRFKVKCRCGGEFSIFSAEGILDLTSQTAKNCEQVRDFEVNTTTETEIQLQWPFPGNHDELIISGYTIRHKTEAQLWNDSYTTDFANINNLKADHMVDDTIRYTVEQLDPSTKYNFEITAKCGTDIAKANDPITGETKPEEEKDCGSDVQCDRSSTEPLAPAPQVDDTVQISDYSMRLITVEADPKGANLWKGKAIAETPMIGFSEAIQMAVAYDSLFVNDANCVTGGNMDVDLTFQILPESIRSQIKNIENLTDSLLNLAQTVIDKTQQGLDSLETYGNQALDHFQGGGGKGMPITGGLGEGIVVDQNVTVGHINYSNGQVTVHGQTADVPVLIKDNEGEVYSVDPTGHITLVGQYNDNVSISNFEEDDRVEVTFSENGDALYGFDAWQEAYGKSVAMAPHYLTIGETSYSAKAITPAMMDKVNFNIQHANKSDIIFTNGQGFVYPPDGSTLNLAGGPENDGQIIYALYVDGSDTTLAGALLVSSYPRVEKKVVLIPTAVPEGLNLDLAKIKEELDETYGQAGITYNVVLDDSFQEDMTWCSRPNCLFQPDGTGLLNNDYTGDEKAVKDKYVALKGASLEGDAAYMFLVAAPIDASKGDEGIQGKMNFGKQFGFVYSAKAQTDKKIGHIIAHEVGHGNYNLYHTFEKMYLGAASESTTDNVMDYKEGHELNKLQWDIVHDPGVTWGVFAKDDDQKQLVVYNLDEFKELQDHEGIYTFLSPSGHYVSIPEDAYNVVFSTLDRYFETSADGNIDRSYPTETLNAMGVLQGFSTIDGKSYISAGGLNFRGYCHKVVPTDDCTYYEDIYSIESKPNRGIATMIGIEGSSFVHYATHIESTIDYSNPNQYKIHKGPIVNSLLIHGSIDDHKTKTVIEYLNSVKSTDSPIEKIGGQFVLANENVPIISLLGNNTLKEFLLSILDENSPMIEYWTYFSLANIKENDLVSYAECLIVNQQLDLMYIQSQVSQAISTISTTDDKQGVTSYLSSLRTLTFEELVSQTLSDVGFGDRLSVELNAGKSIEEIHTFIDNAKPDKCVLNSMDIDVRLSLLRKLIPDNDYWFIDSRNLLKEIIQTTPDYDELKLLKGFMADNYKWLFQMSDQLEEWLEWGEGEDLTRFYEMAFELNKLISRHFNYLEIERTTKTFTGLDANGFTEFSYFPGQEAYIIGADDDDVLTPFGGYFQLNFTNSSNTGAISFLEATGEIHLKQDYNFYDGTPMFEAEDGPKYNRNNPVSYDVKFNPFEPITIRFGKNYAELGYNSGDEMVVPAYMAVLLNQSIANYQFNKDFELITDAIQIAAGLASILAAPATGGGSLVAFGVFMARAGAVIAVMNIKINSEKATLTIQELQSRRDFYARWDAFNFSVGILDFGVGAVGNMVRAPAMIRRLAQIRSWNRFNVVCRQAGNIASSNIRKAWLDIKGFPQQGANMFEYVFKTFKTNSKSLVINGDEATRIIGSVPTPSNLDEVVGLGVSGEIRLLDEVSDVRSLDIDGKVINFEAPVTLTRYEIGGQVYAHIAGSCFIRGTQILMENQEFRSIEDVKKDDKVYCYDHDQRISKVSNVTRVFEKITDSIAKIEISGTVIISTLDHPYFVNGEYLQARDLKHGDVVFTNSGSKGLVEGIEIKDSSVVVYNFEVEKYHNYYVGEIGVLVHNTCRLIDLERTFETAANLRTQLNAINVVGDQRAMITNAIWGLPDQGGDFLFRFKSLGQNGRFLLLDFVNNQTEFQKILSKPSLMESWTSVKAFHPNLAKDVSVLEAFAQLKRNPSLSKLGLSDEGISKLQYYSTGTRQASYKEVLEDLNTFGNLVESNGTVIQNFDKIIGVLQRTDNVGNGYKQGVHWMIKDLNSNGSSFAGKTLKFEQSIPNARATTANSSIDLFCVNCNPANLKVEYKSGPGSITASTIEKQFIERDLFNANSLDEIQWRMDGTEFTKEKLVNWLNDGKSSIKNLGKVKISSLLENDNILNMTNSKAADMLINHFDNSLNYSLIFK